MTAVQGPSAPTAVVGYRGAHMRVLAARGPASDHWCVSGCGDPASDWAYDNADPDERVATHNGSRVRYSLDPARYRPLCRRCHRRFDGTHRANRIRIFSTW